MAHNVLTIIAFENIYNFASNLGLIIIIIIITNKNTKYSQLSSTHVFVPAAIETGGTWHHQAVELVQEIGRRTANITGDVMESNFLFQQLSVALQRGNAVSFQNTFTTS